MIKNILFLILIIVTQSSLAQEFHEVIQDVKILVCSAPLVAATGYTTINSFKAWAEVVYPKRIPKKTFWYEAPQPWLVARAVGWSAASFAFGYIAFNTLTK